MANNRLYLEDGSGASDARLLVAKTSMLGGWLWLRTPEEMTEWLDCRDMAASYGNTYGQGSQLRFVTENQQP